MQHRTIQTLFDYWDEVRAGRLAPRRLEIDPSRISGILAETFMLERMDSGACRFRLAGTRLCELFGFELRGTDILDGWSREDRAIMESLLTGVCEEGAVARIAIEAGIDARHRIELEAVLLPLMHAGNSIGRIMGAMSATTQPHWLDKGRLSSRRLLRHELVRPQGRAKAAGLQNHQPPFPSELSSLRVVKSDRRQFRVLDGGRVDPKYGKS